MEIYATVAMVAGLLYLLLYFADSESGIMEEEKNEMVATLVRWGKKGLCFRKYAALVAIIFLLVLLSQHRQMYFCRMERGMLEVRKDSAS